MQLHEQYRPKEWSEVVGQDKAIAKLERLRKRGLSGRAYWISGQSGTGKTTIAKLIAAEIADDFNTLEVDSEKCTPARLTDIEKEMRCTAIGDKNGRAYIFNESHGLSKSAIRQLLVLLERLPNHVVVIFTTTVDGQESLFADVDDATPLLSRCVELQLSRRDLAKAFAERARMIAQTENMNGKPIGDYEKLVKKCRNNFRTILQNIEAGCMED